MGEPDSMTEDKKIRAMCEKFVEEEVLDKMVEDGIFRVIGINEKGRKIYELTEAGRSPHLIVNPSKTMQ